MIDVSQRTPCSPVPRRCSAEVASRQSFSSLAFSAIRPTVSRARNTFSMVNGAVLHLPQAEHTGGVQTRLRRGTNGVTEGNVLCPTCLSCLVLIFCSSCLFLPFTSESCRLASASTVMVRYWDGCTAELLVLILLE
ncbi:hypothetical protein EYF80_025804 [Liparis tanakae]|uniref:Uncharacterized protein n=1 Tax=Liparis tanakae TaxID=230148 RepID=A0A4Z2HGJ9_9TELE|nr:hypothetical protein EYF80_025804 [Liparis tanakae]